MCGLDGRKLAAVLSLAEEDLSEAVEVAKRIPRRNQACLGLCLYYESYRPSRVDDCGLIPLTNPCKAGHAPEAKHSHPQHTGGSSSV